jgi:hypothetical protein
VPGTIVLQSAAEGRPPWIDRCLASVAGWAERRGYAYRFIGDELFARVPAPLRDKLATRPMTAADLGRLALCREALDEGADTALWLDADVLVFRPEALALPEDGTHAFGREHWIQLDDKGRPKAYAKVHNALALFRRGDALLPFLAHTSERLLGRYDGVPPPHLIGPRLLGPLHNLAVFPLVEAVGSLGPLVLDELLAGGGPCLELLIARSGGQLAAANLCGSLVGEGQDGRVLDDERMLLVVERLLSSPELLA